MDVLKTDFKKCLICKTGDIVEKNRTNTKDGFMVYGRQGSRPAMHVESRCNSTNFDCGAGYYHSYMTYKGMKILHDDALKSQVLVTSNQTSMTGQNSPGSGPNSALVALTILFSFQFLAIE